MAETPAPESAARPMSGPVTSADRITSLDMIRGVAILGILPMNALAFGLDPAAYFNVSADGIRQPFDWVVGVLTMIFVDQKMMALFSMLFGVGVVIFAERAAAKQRRVVWLSLWRFALLFAIGLIHEAFWDGDILALYALCAPVVLLLRRLPASVLVTVGVVLAMLGTVTAPLFQSAIGDDSAELGDLWFAGGASMGSLAEAWIIVNAVGRALGLMLVGVALHRLGIVQGDRDHAYYRRLAGWGLGLGIAVTTIGSVWHIATDWSGAHAINGTIPTGLGTIPMALGYMSLIILWNRSGSRHLERFRNAGRMALSNYLTQTIVGLAMLGWLLDDVDLSRTVIAVWILGVWALQLWWSTWWLERFRYGPFEWAWRCATYRSWQPLRR
ncbi:MAG: DUF418 domain-containing protein [Actinomycetota bacterium]|nr:DUF418 domain-containing protein [Actinomycetota bacterium]